MSKSTEIERVQRARRKDFALKAFEFGVSFDARRFPSDYPAFQENVCLFCFTKETDADKFGSFIHHEQSGIHIHYFCLLLASGLKQRCKDSEIDLKETKHSVFGFLIKDILEEFKRGFRLKCTHCFKYGATIGCSIGKCKSRFHFNCGLNHNVLFQYFDSFNSYCKAHRPIKNRLPIDEYENANCCLCLENINPNIENTVASPCCKTLFHKTCVQNQAMASGRYYFRCPTCNNKDEYTNEMLTSGIYIPERDASWETPEAYEDLLSRGLRCDMQECKCIRGRKHDRSGTKWTIIACLFCGGFGSHIFCGSLKSKEAPFVCEICISAQGPSSVQEFLLQMGFKISDLMQLFKIVDSVQCDQIVTRQSVKRKNIEITPIEETSKRLRESVTPTAIRKSNRRRRTQPTL